MKSIKKLFILVLVFFGLMLIAGCVEPPVKPTISLEKDSIEIYDEANNLVPNKIEYLPFETIAISKMGYKHLEFPKESLFLVTGGAGFITTSSVIYVV